jgi:hypothetical protein
VKMFLDNIKPLIKKLPFTSDARRLLSDLLIYLTWKPKKTSITFPKDIKAQCNEFRENGVLKIGKSYLNFTNYLCDHYVNKKEYPYGHITYPNTDPSIGYLDHALSMEDPKLVEFVLDPFIIDILHCYYGEKPFVRNDPNMILSKANEQYDFATEYHVDRYNQISVMLLLKDIDINCTHMEYLLGTHKRKFGFWNLKMYGDKQTRTKTLFPENEHKLYNLIGKKGDAFLFNSMGIHRAKAITGSQRNILFVNFTNGANLYKYTNNFEINRDLDNFNVIAREADNLVYVSEFGHNFFKNKLLSRYLS